MTPRYTWDLDHQEAPIVATARSLERRAEGNRIADEFIRIMENPHHPLVEYFRHHY